MFLLNFFFSSSMDIDVLNLRKHKNGASKNVLQPEAHAWHSADYTVQNPQTACLCIHLTKVYFKYLLQLFYCFDILSSRMATSLYKSCPTTPNERFRYCQKSKSTDLGHKCATKPTTDKWVETGHLNNKLSLTKCHLKTYTVKNRLITAHTSVKAQKVKIKNLILSPGSGPEFVKNVKRCPISKIKKKRKMILDLD